jgi:uncharacterized protein YigA (DUF484 family)
MPQGSKYGDDFAASILAEANLSDDIGKVLNSHAIPRRTYTSWQARVEHDHKFAELCQKKRNVLEREWKRYAMSSLRKAFQKSQELIGMCDQPEHLEYLNAHIKTVGDLAVNIEVLSDFEQTETETAQTQSSTSGSTRA